ncbi:hypothetical protein PROQFM164_S02g003118 [Penicillium roqueforti FM164]|uniref:Uncharacterized protein n=1 Tax=Penicillium roqueforti (strain FM164) TaxID=1365484 RepID=W6QTV3_PENRF|nr:hypothetical protein PROQFM164_S02g003118 [Penicillium roqueforti FM164]
MVKKSRKKAQKAQQNAHDIQTPAPTEHSQNKKGKAPEQKARFVRSPTLPDNFTPNAGNHESNDETDNELGDASDQDTPIEHKLDPLSR